MFVKRFKYRRFRTTVTTFKERNHTFKNPI